MGIVEFYKKDKQTNRVFLASLFVVISFICLHHFHSLGLDTKERHNVKIAHYSAAKILSLNLQDSCDVFVLDEPLKSVRAELKKRGYGLDIVKEKLTNINQLKYEKILMRTFKLGDTSRDKDISHTSHGYLVTHRESLNCFGLL